MLRMLYISVERVSRWLKIHRIYLARLYYVEYSRWYEYLWFHLDNSINWTSWYILVRSTMEDDKKKMRQERHRVLEQKRRGLTQSLINKIQVHKPQNNHFPSIIEKFLILRTFTPISRRMSLPSGLARRQVPRQTELRVILHSTHR